MIAKKLRGKKLEVSKEREIKFEKVLPPNPSFNSPKKSRHEQNMKMR